MRALYSFVLAGILLASCAEPGAQQPWTIELGEEAEFQVGINQYMVERAEDRGWVDRAQRRIVPTSPHTFPVILPRAESATTCKLENGSPEPWLNILGRYETESITRFQALEEEVPIMELDGVIGVFVSDLRSNVDTQELFFDWSPMHPNQPLMMFSDAENIVVSCSAEFSTCRVLLRIAPGLSVFDWVTPTVPLTEENISDCMDELLAYRQDYLRPLYRAAH